MLCGTKGRCWMYINIGVCYTIGCPACCSTEGNSPKVLKYVCTMRILIYITLITVHYKKHYSNLIGWNTSHTTAHASLAFAPFSL
jgi:hypothetical protein